jgi:hypothetical protein
MCVVGNGDAEVPGDDDRLGGEVTATKVVAAVAASDSAVAAASIAT